MSSFFDLHDACRFLGLNRGEVLALIADKKLDGHLTAGGYWIVSHDSVLSYWATQRGSHGH